ncbi:MAG TPA: hypothetical protein VHL09_05915 [Dehalococcoidia bacterium]|nr:hypothetical protein [Dehalococcoidia bacterium]
MIPQAVRAPIVRYLIEARVGDPRPNDVQSLYRAVDGDAKAIDWLDQRFIERTLPPGWRELEREIEELAYEASAVGIKLERVTGDLIDVEDPLCRLRSLIRVGRRHHQPATDPLPDGEQAVLDDLIDSSRRRIELFVVEEAFYFGLPPIETIQLYEDVEADPRALQYLNRRFNDGEEPDELTALRAEARSLAEGYERLGYLPSAVLGEHYPRTSDRSMRQILSAIGDELESLGGTVGAF